MIKEKETEIKNLPNSNLKEKSKNSKDNKEASLGKENINKSKEVSIKEKNYNQKKETQKGKNVANKVKQKNILEEFRKEQKNMMRNKKELAKKRYEEENKMLKTYGSEVSLRNKENYMRLKLEKEKLREKEKQFDKEYLERKKNKMLSVKKRNNDTERDLGGFKTTTVENIDNENNQKMNYLYTSQVVDELKQNCDELEKLEQEYLKRIEESKQGKENKKPRVASAIKTNRKYKLNDNDKDLNANNTKKIENNPYIDENVSEPLEKKMLNKKLEKE